MAGRYVRGERIIALKVRADDSYFLDLAQRLFSATSATQHGALVALALAELGRCSEAADWQRRVIAAAEREATTQLLEKLRKGLKLYENVQSCRPANETLLRDLLFKK